MKPYSVAIALALVLVIAQHASLAAAYGPRIVIVGAGMSGISAGKRLSDAGIRNLLILEATDRIGGRMHKHNFGGINVEIGANWVEGFSGGNKVNPIWPIVNSTLRLRNFPSDFDSVVGNVYEENGGLYDEDYVQKRMDRADEVEELGAKLAAQMHPSGREDISILAMQRLFNHQPNGPASPVDMVLDYFRYDYEFAEPPRVTSLQNTEPLATSVDFGEDSHFVADQRGFESIVYYIAQQYLSSDRRSGAIVDPRLQLNKVVRQILYNQTGVVVRTEDNSEYSADYVIVSTSLGVLQSDLIQFTPQLPAWKIIAIYRFDMAVYTKIFLKFPRKFWPEGEGKQFFVYASSRRGYYGMWQVHTDIIKQGVLIMSPGCFFPNYHPDLKQESRWRCRNQMWSKSIKVEVRCGRSLLIAEGCSDHSAQSYSDQRYKTVQTTDTKRGRKANLKTQAQKRIDPNIYFA